MNKPTTPEEWNDLFSKVSPAMQAHIERYLTSISHAITNDEGETQGSGSYIEYEGHRFVLTNEHVTREANEKRFTHKFKGPEEIFQLAKPLAAEPDPVDVAICPVPDASWSHLPHETEAIPLSLFAERHAPIEREMLFLYGFTGERSKFFFNTLNTPGTPLLTQEMIPPVQGLHPNEFAINYNTEKSRTFDGRSGTLPLPPGLSGSLVWNTRLVESVTAGRDWSPELAQVTGMLIRWTSGNTYVVAVRVEIIREFLKRNIPKAQR